MKLFIGAGKNRLDGFTHQDSVYSDGLDILCDVKDLDLEVYPRSCETIICTNVFRGMNYSESKKTIKKIIKLATPNCKLYIAGLGEGLVLLDRINIPIDAYDEVNND